jgi:L-ascorbate metabolism protein UlaG (beta-lactamase superfamily)
MPQAYDAPPKSAFRYWLGRSLRLALAVALGVIFALTVEAWVPIGKAPEGERLARMRTSPRFKDGKFTNPRPLWNDILGSVTVFANKTGDASPKQKIDVAGGIAARLRKKPRSGLRVTWLGHSTLWVEIDGARLLIDPVWGERTSPSQFFGPRRWYAPPVALADLPKPDAVLLSHDHYDHLDEPTIRAISQWQTRFIVPLGVGAHLEYWGVPKAAVTEFDWWERTKVGGVELVCTPARHASGRQIFDRNRTLWSGWAMLGQKHRAYYSGDTGFFPELAEIGAKLGPFNVTMIEIGAYAQPWPDWHIGPEQAVKAHQLLAGDVFLPVHWGLFDLAVHNWTEPGERVVVAAKQAGVKLALPQPGGSIEPTRFRVAKKWWPDVPWNTAADDPIVSRGLDLAPH